MMKTLLNCSVLCLLVWCAVAESTLNDASNIQQVVSEILRRLDEKDNQIEKLHQRLVEQEFLNAEQNNRLADQDAVIKTLRKRLSELESESASPAEPMENAIKSMPSNNSAIAFQQADNSSVRKGQQRIRQAITETPVAFFATLTSHISHAGQNQTIAFDRVVTNVGNAYNPHVGVFSAPVTGIYVFSVSLLSYPGHTTGYRLYKNDDFLSNIYLQTPSAGQYESTSQTVVLRLNKGDDVTLRNMKSDEMLHGNNYSTFAGFLVWEDFNVQPIAVGK